MNDNGLVVLYDDQDRLSPFWRLGRHVNRTRRDIAVTSWDEAYERLAAADAKECVRELHVWGHGSRGKPKIAKQGVDLDALFAAVPDLGLVWWRSCSVHKGPRGCAFAGQVARRGAISVGHTEVISAPLFWRQRSICAYTPEEYARGVTPHWEDGRRLRGVSTFRMKVPTFAFRSPDLKPSWAL